MIPTETLASESNPDDEDGSLAAEATSQGAETLIPIASKPHHRIRWGRLLLTALLVMLLAEGGTRLLARDLQPVYRWPNAVLAGHARQLAAMSNDIDLLVVGSSSAGADIRPNELVLDGVAERGYNYWQPGAPMRGLDALTSEVLLQRTSPTTVIIGITMREFNVSEGTASIFRALDESPAFQAATGRQSLFDRFDDWLQSHSEIARRRSLLRDPAELLKELRRDDPAVAVLGDDGHYAGIGENRLAEEPEEHRQQERAVLAGFKVSGQEIAALENLLAEIDERGIEALVINLPVSEAFIDLAPRGRADYDDYLSAVRAATEPHARWLDAMEQTWPDEYFGDVNHLNDRGSERLRPMITAALEASSGATSRPDEG